MESRLPAYDTVRVARLKTVPTQEEWNALVRARRHVRVSEKPEIPEFSGYVLRRPESNPPENPTLYSTIDRILPNDLVYAFVLDPGRETRNDGRN